MAVAVASFAATMGLREVAVNSSHYGTNTRFPRSTLWGAISLVVCTAAAPLFADVVVLANRTSDSVTFQLTPLTAAPWTATLASGDVRPVFSDESLRISFGAGASRKSYQLDPNCAYYFGAGADGRVDLQKLGLHEDAATLKGRTLPGDARTAPVTILPVKIVVDDEEPARQEIWERRLSKRVDDASAILIKHCGVGVRVVAVERWDSDDATTEFEETLAELEREVKTGNAQVAIAFSSQYRMPKGRYHMGGTKGPFHSHILLREWSRHASENERLELLLHELGHWLGAAHSPEPDSVMRPLLSDRQSRRAGFQIKFDPVNTLAMSLVGEEIRRRRITSFGQLTTGTRKRLEQIYSALAPTLPDDPAAKKYQSFASIGREMSLTAATKQVVAAIMSAAVENSQVSQSSSERVDGDALTQLYVRSAAKAAAQLPAEVGSQAFLRGLGIGLDSTGSLAKLPQYQPFLNSVESDSAKRQRLAVLGEPTIRGRSDLTLHFALSAYLTATSGATAASAAGYTKEALDAQGGSGFSFADLAADRAGIRLAEGVLGNRFRLSTLAESFTVRDFMPKVEGLPEGMQSVQFSRDYGGKGDARYELQIREIDSRINALAPYR